MPWNWGSNVAKEAQHVDGLSGSVLFLSMHMFEFLVSYDHLTGEEAAVYGLCSFLS